MDGLAILWFVTMILCLVLESSTVNLITIWFAGGALAAVIINFCGGEIWLQVVVFLVVSVGLLASLRPVIRKYFTPKLVKTNSDAVIGTTGRVLEDINNDLSQGRVKLGALEWSARSSGGNPIPKDTMIRADRIEGVKIYVSEVKEEVTWEA